MGIQSISVSESEQITGAISAFACLLIVLTFVLFKEVRGLRYIELVFYVATNVLIASIGISIGATRNSSQCWFQEITTNFNYLSAIFWTTVITFQVWLVVHYKVVLTDMDMIKMHILCWGVPLFVTFIPLTTNTFGGTDDQNTWCFIAERNDSPAWGILVWPWLTFYAWLYVAIFVNVCLVASIGVHLRRMAVVSNDITATLQKLLLYPMIFFVCWGATTVYDIYGMFYVLSNNASEDSTWNKIVTCLSILQGVLFSLAFFYMNENIRKLWLDMLLQRPDYLRKHARSKGNTNSSSNISRASRISQFSCTWEEEHDCHSECGGHGDHITLSTAGHSLFEIADRRYSSEYSLDSGSVRQESVTGVGLTAIGMNVPNPILLSVSGSDSHNHIHGNHNHNISGGNGNDESGLVGDGFERRSSDHEAV